MSEIEIDVEVVARTDLALLLSSGKDKAWIPRSRINDYTGEKDSPDSVFLPEWYALQEGLI